ncbi:2,3-diaminopropionate biosynthesis protein SbnB [Ammoniphilus resinae]|uniref:Ornithine cyclodeaminase n=1 Tax=Ammoniphilus resinae TaxID=861532 RepID=A0ABS4GSR2_9BACL|nr:2,3-diaminopropionate biosynthesis protein SbnB [Ammoniphilus resinae]MBP1933319.1 ornithine cyclodeaminase [Ammoniphilus resinae]
MLYLNQKDILAMGIHWDELIQTVKKTVFHLDQGDYSQPIKPYLRYGNPKNRIIAMPAYIGGDIDTAGIKWISSFPDNIHRQLPRAHSVVILNDPATGKPAAILHTPLVSMIRTASVSGLMLKHYLNQRPSHKAILGIIGWGPIGQYHFKMCMEQFGHFIERVVLYDLRPIDKKNIPLAYQHQVKVAESWQEAYMESDIVLTCTASDYRYIDRNPKPGSLLMHISLRDYKKEALDSIGTIIVDDWDEVCRENTDIEVLHKESGLEKKDTHSLADVVCRQSLSGCDLSQPVLFSPMGMAVFDISVSAHYVRVAQTQGMGQWLD